MKRFVQLTLALSLMVPLQGLPAPAGAAPQQQEAPLAFAPAAQERPLDQLVLSLDEVGEKVKLGARPLVGSDARSSWHQVIYRRDSDKYVLRTGPQFIINRVYRATDAAAAQQIFNEQVEANGGMPEARMLGLPFGSVGHQAMDPIGEAAQAVGGCERCDSDDEIYRHYRIVFRSGNLVETLYTYGSDSGAYFGVAFGLAKTIEKRINTAPPPPLAEIFSNLPPNVIGMSVQDAGKEAVEDFIRTGSDDRSSWYEARFKRLEETYDQKLGPSVVYNKVFVATSHDAARAIYRESAVRDLPEATEREARGPVFIENKTRRVGNESYAVGACNDDCGGTGSDRLHERLVYRWGNVVVIVYIWGRDDNSNPDVVSEFGARIAGRIS